MNTSRFLVHIHIYYTELWPEINLYLKQIYDKKIFDLYITKSQKTADITQEVLSAYPDAQILTVPNQGYDVGAFIYVLNQIDLDNYDYVIKLHSKRDTPHGSRLNGYHVGGPLWRRYALSFIKTPEIFQHCLDAFLSDRTLGMISHYRLITTKDPAHIDTKKHGISLLSQMGLKPITHSFAAGTMFIVRAKLLKPIKHLGLDINDFTESSRNETISLAHTLERVLGWMIGAQDHTIKDYISSESEQYINRWLAPLRLIWNFIYRSKTNKHDQKIIKIFKIPVYKGKI